MANEEKRYVVGLKNAPGASETLEKAFTNTGLSHVYKGKTSERGVWVCTEVNLTRNERLALGTSGGRTDGVIIRPSQALTIQN